MEYRTVSGADLDWRAYRDIRLLALKTNPEAFGSTYERESAFDDAEWIGRVERFWRGDETRTYAVADPDGRYLALCGGIRQTGTKQAHIVKIVSVFTRPEARGLGLGRTVVRACLDGWSGVPGIGKFSLCVVSEQAPAVSLYRSLGFEIAGTLRRELFHDGRYYDEYVMEKIISSR